MAIMRRTPLASPKKELKPSIIVRRKPLPGGRAYADSVEEYVFTVPHDPIKYSELVVKWILPYQQSSFIMFGLHLRLTPRYAVPADGWAKVTGLLIEIISRRRNLKKIIDGPRGTWHGKIKVFVKSNVPLVEELDRDNR